MKKFHQLNANSEIPEMSDIPSPAKCILQVMLLNGHGYSFTWNVGETTYRIATSASGNIILEAGGTRVDVLLNQLNFPVSGNLTIDWSGYQDTCELFLDGVRVDDRPTTINSDLHRNICVACAACLERSTLITMSDRSTKMVCDLRTGDKVLSLDPSTMNLAEDEVVLCDGGVLKKHDVMDMWAFEDGTTLKTVHPHQFYNVRTGKMEYISSFKIGDRVRKQDGKTTALVGHEVVNAPVYHNTLLTKRFNTYFANGVLTGNRDTVRWGWRWLQQNRCSS